MIKEKLKIEIEISDAHSSTEELGFCYGSKKSFTEVNEVGRWTDLAGGPNMSREYGLGGMARQHISGSTRHGHTARELELEAELACMRQQMDAHEEQMSVREAQMSAQQAQMSAQLEEMRRQLALFASFVQPLQPQNVQITELPYPTIPHGTPGVTVVPTPRYPPHIS